MVAYIDLNPARVGLVRALKTHKSYGADAKCWDQGVALKYHLFALLKFLVVKIEY